jgi:hypothetical protein
VTTGSAWVQWHACSKQSPWHKARVLVRVLTQVRPLAELLAVQKTKTKMFKKKKKGLLIFINLISSFLLPFFFSSDAFVELVRTLVQFVDVC